MNSNTKITQSQLTKFSNMKYSGKEVFNMLINFYKKWDSTIAKELIEEDNHIYNMTGTHYMHDILDYSNQQYFMMKRPVKLVDETFDGENTIFLKKKEANRAIHRSIYYCNQKCSWPDNYGISNVIDKFNKWFCHYNEI